MSEKAIEITLVGTSPLLMHHPRLSDPRNEYARKIKLISGKKKKTDEDYEEMARLEWFGGLYDEDTEDGPILVQPVTKVRKCLVETGAITRSGKAVARAVRFFGTNTTLLYNGPRDTEELYKDGRFVSRMSVGVQGKRVMRCRPQFLEWQLQLSGLFVEQAGLNLDELERIVALAGKVTGIGDARNIGFGRFEGKLKVLK